MRGDSKDIEDSSQWHTSSSNAGLPPTLEHDGTKNRSFSAGGGEEEGVKSKDPNVQFKFFRPDLPKDT